MPLENRAACDMRVSEPCPSHEAGDDMARAAAYGAPMTEDHPRRPRPLEPREEIRCAARAFMWLLRLRDPRPVIPFVPMPEVVRAHIVERLHLGPDDHVLDLGCGDGATLIDLAARSGCRGTGIERDPDRVAAAWAAVGAATRPGADGTPPRLAEGRVQIVEGDFEDEALLDRLGLDRISVAVMFLFPWAVQLLVPRLVARLPADGRVVSYTFADEHFAEGEREMVPGFAYPGHRVPLYVWEVGALRAAAAEVGQGSEPG